MLTVCAESVQMFLSVVKGVGVRTGVKHVKEPFDVVFFIIKVHFRRRFLAKGTTPQTNDEYLMHGIRIHAKVRSKGAE